MTPEELLAKAAEDMSKHGKSEKKFYDSVEHWETAPACAYGSMGRVLGMTHQDGSLDPQWGVNRVLDRAAAKLAETIVRLVPDHDVVKTYAQPDLPFGYVEVWDVVTNYNDSVGKEDMILAMKEAAHG